MCCTKEHADEKCHDTKNDTPSKPVNGRSRSTWNAPFDNNGTSLLTRLLCDEDVPKQEFEEADRLSRAAYINYASAAWRKGN